MNATHALLFAGILAFFAAPGCTDREQEQSPTETKTQSLWTAGSLTMGEGMDLTRDPNVTPGTGNICVQGSYEAKREDEAWATVFYSYDSSEIERTLTASIGLEGNIEGIDFSIDNAIDKYSQSEQYGSEILVIGANLRQVRETWKPDPDAPSTSSCDGSQSRTFSEFVSDCGTHYLKSRVLGGRLIILARSLKTESGEELSASTGRSVGSADVVKIDLAASLEYIKTEMGDDYELYVFSEGLPNAYKLYDPNATGGDDVDNVLSVDTVLQNLQDALSFDINVPNSWGNRIVFYETAPYTSSTLQGCGTPGSIFQSYECLQTYQRDYRENIGANASLAASIAEVQSRIDKGTKRYVFDETFGYGDTSRLEALVQDYETCVNDVLPQVDDACADALQQGTPMCDVCCLEGTNCQTQAPECDPRSLIERATDIIRNVTPHDGTNNAPTCDAYQCGRASVFEVYQDHSAPTLRALGSASDGYDDSVCSFGGVKGKFDSVNTEVRMIQAPSPNGPTWVASVSGDNTKSSEKLTGYFFCSPKENFQTATGQLAPRNMGYEQVELQLTDFVDMAVFNGQLPAIAGFSGNFRGGAEWIKRDRSRNRFRSSTNQNQLYSWIHGYGFYGDSGLVANTRQFINGGESRSVSTNGGAVEARLMDADEGHCMLEHIGGKFDGRGEEAYVQLRRDPSQNDEAFWVLRVDGADGKPVNASAICLDYLQP